MKNKQPLLLGIGIGFLTGALLVFSFGRMIPAMPTGSSFKVTGPDGKTGVEIRVDGGGVEYEKVLHEMFASDFLRPAATGWLADKQNLYSLEGDRLVNAISTKLCEPIPTTPVKEMLDKGKACAEKPAALGLRELAFNHRPPFHYVGFEAKMGVVQLAAGKANVCRDRGLRGKRLQVANAAGSAVIEVDATGWYRCTPAAEFPDIQLSFDDAKQLFGDRPLARLETVIVVPLE